MTPEIPEKIPIVKGLYANKSEILQAKTNPKTLNEAQNLTEKNQDYYEIPPDEGYIRPYFDWDKKLDHEPNQDEIQKEGEKAMEDLKALGFTGAYWATRHGLSASGRHKISYRAWIPKFKTTKSDLNRRVRNYIKANPSSSLDAGVYDERRKMGMVNCIKGDTEIYPKDPAYDKNSKKKRQFLPDTRILKPELQKFITETNKLKALKQTIISIVDEDAEIWELDEDEYQSIQAEPPSPKSTEAEDFTSDETFDPTDYKELYEKYYTNPIFYGTKKGKHKFSCDEKGRDECWNCGQVHSSNNYTTWRDEAGNIHTKNMSKEKGCKSRIINEELRTRLGLPQINNTFTRLSSGNDYGSWRLVLTFTDPVIDNTTDLTYLNEARYYSRASSVGINTEVARSPLDVRSGEGTSGTNWVAGSFGDEGDNTEHVVMGNFYGLPTIGGHSRATGAWTAWEHLSLNPGGGNVGVGLNSTPKAKLHVNGQGGYAIAPTSGYYRAWFHASHGVLNDQNQGWGGDISIYANRDIMSGDHIVAHNGTLVPSDQRIKKDIVDVDDASALENLRLLKPKKYKYKDTISRGEDPVWGFIAQEVRETLPHATRLRKEFLPNIYEVSNVSDSNVITFSSFNTSNLETTTSKLRLKCIDGNDKEVSIVEVIDETKIRVNEDLSECIGAVDEDGNVVSGNQIFVYGEEVDDFVFLKKEVFIPICVSSIQELDRRLEAEKTKVADLLARVENLENNMP